jgi:hypothetical protein
MHLVTGTPNPAYAGLQSCYTPTMPLTRFAGSPAGSRCFPDILHLIERPAYVVPEWERPSGRVGWTDPEGLFITTVPRALLLAHYTPNGRLVASQNKRSSRCVGAGAQSVLWHADFAQPSEKSSVELGMDPRHPEVCGGLEMSNARMKSRPAYFPGCT